MLTSIKEHIINPVEEKANKHNKTRALEEEVKTREDRIKALEEKVRMLEQNK